MPDVYLANITSEIHEFLLSLNVLVWDIFLLLLVVLRYYYSIILIVKVHADLVCFLLLRFKNIALEKLKISSI
jgi:hypothetical protein